MAMKNIKLEISYDGTNFCGFQIQPELRTVQGELQRSLSIISQSKITINASGRTDTGVHARKQVCNFLTELDIPSYKWAEVLNPLLPDDIVILNSSEVPLDFHSRYHAKRKTYRYAVHHNKTLDVFRRNYTWFYPYPLDITRMQEASQLFLGEHDFTAFSSIKASVKSKIRIISSSEVWQEGNEIYFQVTGNGFLYNMVRIMMGTLISCSRNKITPTELIDLFSTKERGKAGTTAPAKGLTLWDVEY